MRSSNGQLSSDARLASYSYLQETPTLRVGDFLDPIKNLQYFSWSGYEPTTRKMSYQDYNA